MVILFNKIGLKPFTALLTLIFFLGIYLNFLVAQKYELSAFILALSDYYKYSHFQNKPWMKVSVYSLGLLSGVLFNEIKQFKQQRRENR